MISRREIVTGGMWGSLAAGVGTRPGAGGEQAAETAQTLRQLRSSLDDMRAVLDRGLVQPGLAHGHVGRVRDALTVFLRSTGRFPEFCEIGASVFYDVYDWHIKYNQPIQLSRTPDNRLTIQFMFTQLILRWENEPTFVGVPFERA